MNRREFLTVLAQLSIAGMLPGCAGVSRSKDLYQLPVYGQVRILHITDTHAQLLPVYFREPSANLGIGDAYGKLPHRVGKNLLDVLPNLRPAEVHALTCLDFDEAAERFGRMGGYAHLATLIARLRAESHGAMLLDGGDTWQGSATSLWSGGMDMVGASNLLGVDVMTGHWEFTYGEQQVRENLESFNGTFVAQNIVATEDALFDGVEVFDESSGRVFPPYVIKQVNGRRVAVVGQAFPYTPIANPGRFVPDWSFGIRETELASLVTEIRQTEHPDAVVLLSHNGMDVDLKLASRVAGIDFIVGGHTHDAVPVAVEVSNSGGITVVTNAGCNGKFVGVLDLEFNRWGLSGYRYQLLPVFANLLEPDPQLDRYIEEVRRPHRQVLDEELAVAETTLYRRGNFNGTFDQVICNGLIQELDAQIAFSPGFRWGSSVLPFEAITMEDLLGQTAITYAQTYVSEMTGAEIKFVMESVADNIFHENPYYQQGGDMLRTGGLRYECWPNEKAGNRIKAVRLRDGTAVNAAQTYKVAGWAAVNRQEEGRPVWEVVASYLRDKQTVVVNDLETPTLRGVSDNPGLT